MSHSHVRVPRSEPEPPKRMWLGHIVVGAFVLAILGEIFAVRMSPLNFTAPRETTYGTILETRIDAMDPGSSRFGGYVEYRITARVSYSYRNTTEVRWMPASELSQSREWLEARLNRHPTLCLVYWSVGHSDNPRCSIQSPISQ